jgi:4'-phosphopantetheinyl transferase
MPLWLKKDLPNNAYLGIWKIEEDEAFFLQQLDLQPVEQAELAPVKGRRRLEWLASRYLVHDMLLGHGHDDRVPVLKDDCGKPHLWGTPFHLSFSHSYDFVAVILANAPAGVDIQKFVPKIGAIAHKFMREEESACLAAETRLEHLHIFWGAKEALYKAYGRRELDFRQHIFVEPFEFKTEGETPARVIKDDFNAAYRLVFEKIENHFLVYCIEIE